MILTRCEAAQPSARLAVVIDFAQARARRAEQRAQAAADRAAEAMARYRDNAAPFSDVLAALIAPFNAEPAEIA